MRNEGKLTLGIKLLLPLLLAVLLNLSPQAGVIRTALSGAQSAAAQGEPEAAAEHLQQAAACLPWRGDVLEQLGEQRMLAGQYVRAAAAFQKAWLLDEISDDGLEKLAEAHLALGEDSGAIRAWEARIERDGADGQFFSALAAAYRRQGDMAGAAAAVQAWQEQYPGDAHAAYALGIHLVLVSPQDAEQMLKLASELAPAYTVKCDGLVEGVQTALTFDDDAYRLLLLGAPWARLGSGNWRRSLSGR